MALTVQIYSDPVLQRNGRRNVLEVHSDAQGEVSRVLYRAAAEGDYQAVADARAIELRATLARQELVDAIREDRMPTLRFSTAQEMADYIVRQWPELRGALRAELCWWIRNRIVAGEVTDNQLQNVFGLTAPQWSARKATIQALAAQYDAVKDAAP